MIVLLLMRGFVCFGFCRFDLREENRKDVLRTLYALIHEANTANVNGVVPSNTAAAITS